MLFLLIVPLLVGAQTCPFFLYCTQSRWQLPYKERRCDSQDLSGSKQFVKGDSRFSLSEVKGFSEISGVAYSKQKPNGHTLMWAKNDGNSEKRLGLFDLTTMKLIQRFGASELNGGGDTEDIAVGPCGGKRDKECIYVFGGGDNAARLKSPAGTQTSGNYRIFKFEEPTITAAMLSGSKDSRDSKLGPVETIYYKFDTSKGAPTQYADCEAIFVDNVGFGTNENKGDIYLVTKMNETSLAGVFRLPVGAQANANTRAKAFAMEKVAGTAQFDKAAVTRADMSRDGYTVAVGTLGQVFFWVRNADTTLADMFTQTKCPHSKDTNEHNYATALSPDMRGMVEVKECGLLGLLCPNGVEIIKTAIRMQAAGACNLLLRRASCTECAKWTDRNGQDCVYVASRTKCFAKNYAEMQKWSYDCPTACPRSDWDTASCTECNKLNDGQGGQDCKYAKVNNKCFARDIAADKIWSYDCSPTPDVGKLNSNDENDEKGLNGAESKHAMSMVTTLLMMFTAFIVLGS